MSQPMIIIPLKCHELAEMILREKYPASSDADVDDLANDIYRTIDDFIDWYYFDLKDKGQL